MTQSLGDVCTVDTVPYTLPSSTYEYADASESLDDGGVRYRNRIIIWAGKLSNYEYKFCPSSPLPLLNHSSLPDRTHAIDSLGRG